MKKVGVIGSGAISDIFLKNMINTFDNLEVVACSSKGMESAKKKAEEYGIKAISVDEMMNDEEIEVIVNLTPVPAHYEIIKNALEHGKHVYTEKVLTKTYEQAKELSRIADEKGVALCSAPDTFLGAAIQTAKKMVEDGEIGRVSSVDISFNRDISILAEFFRFVIEEGAGAGYDFGIYFLTAILSILGPVTEVAGIIQTNEPNRTYKRPENPKCGEAYTIKNENVMVGILRFANGTLGTINFNTDTIFPEGTNMTLYGSKGILSLPNPNNFGG